MRLISALGMLARSCTAVTAASIVSWWSSLERDIVKSDDFHKAVSIATNSLVSITTTKMLLTPTRRVGVSIGQKNAIATNSSSDYSVGVNNSHKSAIGTNLTLCMLFVILY